MSLLFIIQLLCYDRPRLFQMCRRLFRDESDVESWLKSLPSGDVFRSEGLHRFKQRHAVYQMMAQHGIHWMSDDHAEFPRAFGRLSDPPLGLFYKGHCNMNAGLCCGMVGSRRASVMAAHRIESLMAVVHGTTVVSGGALGIDALVHQHALQRGLPTIAVLTGGLDAMYPASNHHLFHRIIDSGAGVVVSECPPGVRPKPYYFPQRNRLIAALSKKLIVVEAAQRSGALLTANLALNLGQDIAAMVGGFNSPHSTGCYDLINDGAVLIGNIRDAQQFLGLEQGGNQKKASKKTSLCTALFSPDADANLAPDALAQFLEMVPVEPIHLDDLAGRLQLPYQQIIDYISRLALNEDIMILPGQQVFRRV